MTSFLAPAPQPSHQGLNHGEFGFIILTVYILIVLCVRKPEYVLYPCLKLLCVFILGPFVVCAFILLGPIFVCFKIIQTIIVDTRHQTGQAHLDIESGGHQLPAAPPQQPAGNNAGQPRRPKDWSGYYEIFSHLKVGECSICLGEFEEPDECARLRKCKHTYHRECIDLWLPKSCPICRQNGV